MGAPVRVFTTQKLKEFVFSLDSLYPIRRWCRCLENENQLLLYHFSRWCTCAGMIIRVEKCSKFGLKKASTSSMQFLPKLTLNNAVFSSIEIENSLTYLGRYFKFNMNIQQHMSDLLDKTNNLMSTINDLLVIQKISSSFTFAFYYLNFLRI